MRFSLIDRIETLEPGVQISAVKNLSMAEEYLADHFPGFPVMPGVLMLEAMAEAGAWLVRVTDDYTHSMVVLAEVRNVKYGQFVQPGETLRIAAELVEHGEKESKLRAQGLVGDQVTVRGQIVLRRYNLADEDPRQAWIDEGLIEELRSQLVLLQTGSRIGQPMGTA